MKSQWSLVITAVFFTVVTAVAGAFRADSEQSARLTQSPLKAPLKVELTPNLAKSDSAKTSDLLPKRPVHPDESASDTLDQRFSLGNSLERISQIDAALGSFRQLTAKSQTGLAQQEVTAIANTDWETQNLGFHNWVSSVEGTLRKQDYQIKKLEFELAQKQYQDGEIGKAALDQKALAYQKAAREFQTFWNSFRIAD